MDMETSLGLFELILVFVLVLGWGIWELLSLRRARRADKRANTSHDD